LNFAISHITFSNLIFALLLLLALLSNFTFSISNILSNLSLVLLVVLFSYLTFVIPNLL
jgi:hypothetical protein